MLCNERKSFLSSKTVQSDVEERYHQIGYLEYMKED